MKEITRKTVDETPPTGFNYGSFIKALLFGAIVFAGAYYLGTNSGRREYNAEFELMTAHYERKIHKIGIDQRTLDLNIDEGITNILFQRDKYKEALLIYDSIFKFMGLNLEDFLQEPKNEMLMKKKEDRQ